MKATSQLLDKKLELIQWLSTLEDDATIEKLLLLRKEETQQWRVKLSDTERASIEKGIVDADKQKLSPHSSVRSVYEKWL